MGFILYKFTNWGKNNPIDAFKYGILIDIIIVLFLKELKNIS